MNCEGIDIALAYSYTTGILLILHLVKPGILLFED